MVLSKQAEWAAVDSTTLLYSKKYMQDGGKEIITLETLGRLPPYPVVVNSRLPGTTLVTLEYLSNIILRLNVNNTIRYFLQTKVVNGYFLLMSVKSFV